VRGVRLGFALLLCSLAVSTIGCGVGTLTGTVTRADGSPAAYVKVGVVSDTLPEGAYPVPTGSTGHYLFRLKPGAYQLYVAGQDGKMYGYAKVDVGRGEQTVQDIKLSY